MEGSIVSSIVLVSFLQHMNGWVGCFHNIMDANLVWMVKGVYIKEDNYGQVVFPYPLMLDTLMFYVGIKN